MFTGPRCKTVNEGLLTDRPAAEQIPCMENMTSEPSVEKGGNFLLTANENSRNSITYANNPGRYCEVAPVDAAPKLTDPFDFHIYVGFSPKNLTVIARLMDTLKSRWNLHCCHRQATEASEEAVDTRKEEGESKHLIARSEKCLLYVTPEYVQEPWIKTEVAAVVKKARRFSIQMLFGLKDPRISAECLNELGLKEFPMSDWPQVDDDTLPNRLVSWLLQDVELAPIPRMPEKISGRYLALVYFFGYLNLVLDDYRQKMESVVVESGEKVALPMLIVVPKSCKAPESFNMKEKILLCSGKYVMTPSHHGGSKNREYRISVMKLIVPTGTEENDIIYFSGEFPACLLTVYETFKTGETGMTKDQLDKILNEFYFTLQSLLCHPHNKHCVDQYRLMTWPDDSDDLYDFLLPIVCSVAEERDASSLVVRGPRSVGLQLVDLSFNRLESCNNPRKLWSGIEPYVMRNVSPRGICLIVNISDAMPKSIADRLSALFSDNFDFNVRVHSDCVTWDQLDSLLCDVAEEDHSHYDAFVCYIASRGHLGTVSTPDGSCISIIDLVHIFNNENRETLHGKPKLFLVQTTDDETTDDPVFDDNETQVQISVLVTVGLY